MSQVHCGSVAKKTQCQFWRNKSIRDLFPTVLCFVAIVKHKGQLLAFFFAGEKDTCAFCIEPFSQFPLYQSITREYSARTQVDTHARSTHTQVSKSEMSETPSVSCHQEVCDAPLTLSTNSETSPTVISEAFATSNCCLSLVPAIASLPKRLRETHPCLFQLTTHESHPSFLSIFQSKPISNQSNQN